MTQAFADDVAKTLADDKSIPKDLRIHVTYLVDHLKWCLSKYAEAGDFELVGVYGFSLRYREVDLHLVDPGKLRHGLSRRQARLLDGG